MKTASILILKESHELQRRRGMNIKITVKKSEVMKIVENHVLISLPINMAEVDVYTHESFGEYIVAIDPKKSAEVPNVRDGEA